MTIDSDLQTAPLKEFKRIQQHPLEQNSFDEIYCFPECGGIGIFVGTVRNHHEGRAVKALKYTAYAPVAEKMIRQIEQDIQKKYHVSYVRVIHRVGALDIGDKAIIAIAYAPHRREAFVACEEAVERVKHEVPVWKEEFYMDGSSQYVAGCCIRKDYTNSEISVAEAITLTEDLTSNITDHVHHADHCTHDHGSTQQAHSHRHDASKNEALMCPSPYQWHM